MSLEKLIQKLKSEDVLESNKMEEALRNIRREDFVRDKHRKHAYSNLPLPIGEGQTISQPLVVVKMTEWLKPQKGERILEVGTGSGWQAGLIAYLVGREGVVYSVERHHKLAEFAKANLKRTGISNVKIIEGDGSTGYENKSPYNSIIVTAAAPKIMDNWKKQLKDGGKIVVPIGKDIQTMVCGEKINNEIKKIKTERGYRFVPLKGKKGL